MKAYQPLAQKDPETGLWYKEWDVPDGLPVSPELIFIAPGEELTHPRWDSTQGIWVEDKNSVLEDLKDKVASLEERLIEYMEGSSKS